MGMWDIYQDRIEAHGTTKRGAALQREVRFINTKLPDSLSYQHVVFYDKDHGFNITSHTDDEKYARDVAIVNTDNLDEKFIFSMPGEDIEHGGLVYWMDNYWLVTERDANTTVYTRAKMIQCNYLLKWIENGSIFTQWCIIEDGTKYLTGEFEDRNFVVTRGDSRIAMTIAKNEHTVKFNRLNRFLIDDPESPLMLSYSLSKPLKLGWSFNGNGAFKFVLQEVNSTDDDNHELCIADYYKYFPRIENENTGSGDTSGASDDPATGDTPGTSDEPGNEPGTSATPDTPTETGNGGWL